MDLSDLQPFLPLITGAIGGSASAGAFAGPIQTLQDWWYINFGHSMSERAELLKAKQELNIQAYRDNILEEASKISPENIQEPKLSIMGPALEASKYYIEEENLRKMFAKIVASSMDKTQNGIIHPSFVEIIKQLSSHDANVLMNIKKANVHVGSPYPAMKMVIVSDQGIKYIFKLIVVFDNETGFQDNAISINNLNRLGILEVDMGTWSVNDANYDIIKNDFVVKSILDKNPDMELQKGSYSVTNFGKNFIDICVE